MKNYYRIMLGRKSAHSEEAYKGGFIGADFSIDQDLAHHLSDDWRAFNKEYIPKCIEKNPGKTRVSAGLACGMLWTIAKGVRVGDVVLCPDGKGAYHAGEVVGGGTSIILGRCYRIDVPFVGLPERSHERS